MTRTTAILIITLYTCRNLSNEYIKFNYRLENTCEIREYSENSWKPLSKPVEFELISQFYTFAIIFQL